MFTSRELILPKFTQFSTRFAQKLQSKHANRVKIHFFFRLVLFQSEQGCDIR